MIIKCVNFLDQMAQFTFLSQQASTGAGTLSVQNANPFSAQWAIQLGQTGESQTEIVLLGTAVPSGTTLVTSGTRQFIHPTDTPVFAIKYDQIVWKRSTTGTSGSATAFATTNITPSNQNTIYDDTTGLSTYAYKTAFLSSALGLSSQDSDWITPSGYSFYSLAAIRQRVKNKLFSTTFIGGDSVVDEWINEYLEMMTNTAIDVNEDYNMGSTNISFSGTNQLGTITATDFKQLRRVWMTADGVSFAQAQKMDAISPAPGQVFSSSMPYFFLLGDNVMSRWPAETSGTASCLYYKLNPVLVDDGDELPIAMQGYTKGFVDYALAQAKSKDGRPDEARVLESTAFAMLDRFKREITPRTKTGQSTIQIVETVEQGDVGDFWN